MCKTSTCAVQRKPRSNGYKECDPCHRCVSLSKVQSSSFDSCPFDAHCQTTAVFRWRRRQGRIPFSLIIHSLINLWRQFDLPSVGGYLQLDRCIYPYIISSSDILLNLNDLRKPFDATLHLLLPYFHVQPAHLIINYMRIVDYGTRSIKKYKYYYKNVDEKFISLNQLLLLHRSFLFVQLFNAHRVPLRQLHEYYRTDFSSLLSNSLATCGYVNDQPCLGIWSLFDARVNSELTSRLATLDETILINWLLIYGNRADRVHHQVDDVVLVKQDPSSMRDKVKSIQSEHMRQRSIFTNILNTWSAISFCSFVHQSSCCFS